MSDWFGPRDGFAAAEALWRDWNGKINVVSRKDIDFLWEHHILHSLALGEYLRLRHPDEFARWQTPGSGVRVLDLGTGGGFPGIPLAIAFPEVQFTLCDSIGKKITVARSVAEGLDLRNVACVCSRAEALEGSWDWVVSRAVAPLETLFPWVAGRFEKGLLCLKGGDVNEEIFALGRRFGVPASVIGTWPVDNWIRDAYFAEKFVIEIEKTYLCRPKSGKYKNRR
ncbi:MAG: 16S rRNA (guanine(527)-N(7))-methyltransferase RsmG [Bacteroidales bacterium]|nr:16S rRNA (guanine(527)-N(7))-methyltransferase RsmG [Bacteroidales bacterium]